MGWLWASTGPSGFGSCSTAEHVTQGIDASHLTAIVTGGSSGIGEETARVLALRGAQVVIAVRNLNAGERVKNMIVKVNSSARVHVLELNLSSMNSIRNFVDKFCSLNIPLNLLINNAGVMACPFSLSEDGIELQFATNHIGHFLLTSLLTDKLKATAQESGIEGRIVNVSSLAHKYPYSGGIRFDKINDKESYNAFYAYGQSKLANILHANELSRRFKEEGIQVTANSLHPGSIKTNLQQHNRFLAIFTNVVQPFNKSIPQGASTQCYLALHQSLRGVSGKYFCDCNEATSSAYAKDTELALKLWEFSEKLINDRK